ncbi:MAG: IPT/TIG domain-containing protein, partial [Myxococcota bacterium]
MTPGQHHLRLVDEEFSDIQMGALVVGAPQANAQYTLSRDNGPIEGGFQVHIRADRASILPGTQVKMRALGETAYHPSDEEDFDKNVLTMHEVSFTAPGVTSPGLYDVLLRFPNGDEQHVGLLSYDVEPGRAFNLPGYPPHIIGDLTMPSEDLLLVGVKGGETSPNNRFAVSSGLELFDMHVWENPVRLSQLETRFPVTGVEVSEQVAYLAAGEDGLMVVSLHDTQKPYVLNTHTVPGMKALDVALAQGTGTLAVAWTDGQRAEVRFYNTRSPELAPSVDKTTLTFGGQSWEGIPVDLDWDGEQLFVLSKHAGALDLTVVDTWDTDGEPATVTTHQGLARLPWDDGLSNTSMSVGSGQVFVTATYEGVEGELPTVERQFVAYRPACGQGVDSNWSCPLQPQYWQTDRIGSGAQALHASGLMRVGGFVYASTLRGFEHMPTPGGFVVMDVDPDTGTSLGLGATLTAHVSDWINTSTAHEGVALALTKADGTRVTWDASYYTVTATNTIRGSQITVELASEPAPELVDLEAGTLELELSSGGLGILSTDGLPLVQTATRTYGFQPQMPPALTRVLRLDGSDVGPPYFHMNGSEQARIEGDFGAWGAADVCVWVGGAPATLASDALDVVDSVGQLTIGMPTLSLPNVLTATALDVTVQVKVGDLCEGAISELRGAVVLMPPVHVQQLYPESGPAAGGNWINVYGVGFAPGLRVAFGETVAGEVELLSASHGRVRVPSQAPGVVDVSASSPYFPNETQPPPLPTYRYTTQGLGAVQLTEGENPIAGFVRSGQLLYAVTGGSYNPVSAQGVRGPPAQSSAARLLVLDVSEPVRPTVVERELAGSTVPHFLDQFIAPEGFRSIAQSGEHLYLLGGHRLYHMSVVLGAQPIELEQVLLQNGLMDDVGHDVLAERDLVYVTSDAGLRIWRLNERGLLESMVTIPTSSFGDVPESMVRHNGDLWVTLPHANAIAQVELLSGDFALTHVVEVRRLGDGLVRPTDMLLHDGLLMVAGGDDAVVLLYSVEGQQGQPLAELPLVSLNPYSHLRAHGLMLRGQDLYVAANDGDVQVFPIAEWLDQDEDFGVAAEPRDILGVAGAARSMAAGKGAIYVGSVGWLEADGVTENPQDGAAPLTGVMTTLADTHLTVVETWPPPGGDMHHTESITVEFNRVVDPESLTSTITQCPGDCGGMPTVVALDAHAYDVTRTGGTLLTFPLVDGAQSGVVEICVDGANDGPGDGAGVVALNGSTLVADYCWTVEVKAEPLPMLGSVVPNRGGWRGGQALLLRGTWLDANTQVFFGDDDTPAMVTLPNPPIEGVIEVTTPLYPGAQQTDKVVGIRLVRGDRSSFYPLTYTYVADPSIEEVGLYDYEQQRLQTDQKVAHYNRRPWIGVRGRGFGDHVELWVNNRPVDRWEQPFADLLVFQAPERTLGTLTIEVRSGDGSASAINDEMEVQLTHDWSLGSCTAFVQSGSRVAVLSNHAVRVGVVSGSSAPVFTASLDVSAQDIA